MLTIFITYVEYPVNMCMISYFTWIDYVFAHGSLFYKEDNPPVWASCKSDAILTLIPQYGIDDNIGRGWIHVHPNLKTSIGPMSCVINHAWTNFEVGVGVTLFEIDYGVNFGYDMDKASKVK